jgi:hypothetical protein
LIYADVLLARQHHFHCGQHSTYAVCGAVLFLYVYAEAEANMDALISDGLGLKHSDHSGNYSFLELELLQAFCLRRKGIALTVYLGMVYKVSVLLLTSLTKSSVD